MLARRQVREISGASSSLSALVLRNLDVSCIRAVKDELNRLDAEDLGVTVDRTSAFNDREQICTALAELSRKQFTLARHWREKGRDTALSWKIIEGALSFVPTLGLMLIYTSRLDKLSKRPTVFCDPCRTDPSSFAQLALKRASRPTPGATSSRSSIRLMNPLAFLS